MSEIKLQADSGGGTVSWKGPATTTSDAHVQFVLPVADGGGGTVLKTDGSGNLSWIYPAGTGAFRAYRNAGQTIVHDTWDIIEYEAETFDTKSWYDTSTFKYTPQVAGYYQFDAGAWLGVVGSDNLELQLSLYKNTTRYSRSNKTDDASYNNQQGVKIHDVIQLYGSSDYVQVRLLQYNSSSSNRDLSGGSQLNYFSGYLVEAT